MNIAAIDIGSNAIRLLVKNTQHPNFVHSLDTLRSDEYYERVPLKSGIDVFAHSAIQLRTEMILTAAICRFARIMKAYGVEAYRACATSAYRDAANGDEVIARVNAASGLNIEIISGNEEARITRLSFVTPPEWQSDYLLFVDVGGGSTELSLLRKGQLHYSHSFQIGSMRYVCGNQSAAEEQALDRQVAQIAHTDVPVHYLGVGGCVKFFNQYLNGKNGSNVIRVAQMEAIYNRLVTLSVDQIVEEFSLPRERADILAPASSVFLRIAHRLNAPTITVPSIGVRNGILTELYNNYKK